MALTDLLGGVSSLRYTGQSPPISRITGRSLASTGLPSTIASGKGHAVPFEEGRQNHVFSIFVQPPEPVRRYLRQDQDTLG
jgi:hypothetical protein